MEHLFTSLSNAVGGPVGLALCAAFAWGALSILLSPCHLAGIPLILGYIEKQGETTARRAFTTCLLFSLGTLAAIALIGAITAAAGRLLGDVGPWVNYGVAAVFFVMGLSMLDAIRIPLKRSAQRNVPRKGVWAAFIMGLVFGMALGPCTFAFMAPVLALAFRMATSSPWFGMLLLGLYGLGYCTVIVFVGTFVEAAQRYLAWNDRSRGTLKLRKACGVLTLLGGLYFIYTAR